MKIFIGVDVGGTTIKAGAVTSQGQLISEVSVPTPAQDGPQLVLAAINSAVLNLRKNLKDQTQNFHPEIGVGWPGPVDSQSGLIFETHNIKGFSEFQFYKHLQANHQMKAIIANDAKCAASAEKYFGKAKNYRNFIYLTFGTGIGGVIFSNDQMVSGNQGLAGEIGHMNLYPNGELCGCGSRGCFERYCSAIALERRYRLFASEEGSAWVKDSSMNVTAKELLEFYEAETNSSNLIAQQTPSKIKAPATINPLLQLKIVEKTFEHFLTDLSIGLGSLMTLLNPEAILFSGGLFKSRHERLLKALRAKVDSQGFKSMKKDVAFVASELQGKAGILGAASLVMPSQLG